MTENTEHTAAKYDGNGLKGPLYWLAGVVTGKLALNAMQGNGILGGGASSIAAQAANTTVAYEMAKKDSEIALLKSGQETDKKLVDVYTTLRALDKNQDANMSNIDKRLAALETAAPLREQIVMGKIGEVATLAQNGIGTNSLAISNLAATVASVTKVVIPNSNVCPGWGTVTVTPSLQPFTPPSPFNPPTPGPTPA